MKKRFQTPVPIAPTSWMMDTPGGMTLTKLAQVIMDIFYERTGPLNENRLQ